MEVGGSEEISAHVQSYYFGELILRKSPIVESYEEMSLPSFLATDIIIHCLQILGIMTASTLLYLSRKTRMIRNPNLYLMHTLVVTDLLHATTTLPYIIYLTAGWNAVAVDYDSLFIMISSSPLAIQLKINLIIIIAIAADRLVALYFPGLYRQKNHGVYAICVVIVAVAFGFFDVGLNFYLSPITPKHNCAAIGCFVSDSFRYYWGTSNALLGIVVVILTVVMLMKLKMLATEHLHMDNAREDRRFRKANRSALCTLISSVICITIPSVFAGVFEMTGYSIFRSLGPFYIVGLLCAGCSHSISQLAMNRELKNGLKTSVSAVTTVEVSKFT